MSLIAGTRVGSHWHAGPEIAAIALAHDTLLLSASLRDFRHVPGLRVENCLAT
ncbi:MAG: hypothetical protein L0Y71_00815 [Gemmataceae bacterium]|nr:hypothetical protein [Gemmataceae bacterium]